MLGDWRPHAYVTRDFGETWRLVTDGANGVPARCPTRVLREDPEQPGLLYLGTESGLFVSVDAGTTWNAFAGPSTGMPRATVITDLRIHGGGDLVMSTMGRSFWVVDDLTPLRAWARMQAEGAVLDRPVWVQPRPAVRGRYRARVGVPAYPAPGSALHYWLPAGFEGAVELVIRRGDRTIRRFSSGKSVAKSESESAQPSMRSPDPGEMAARRARRGGLTARAGHNRFVWDLRHEGLGRGRPGPLVAPAVYGVEVRIESASGGGLVVLAGTLEVRPDPRLAGIGVTVEDLAEQEALELRVQELSRRAGRLRRRIDAQLEPDAATEDGRREELGGVRRKLVTAVGIEYPQPMLIDQIRYLAGVIGRADQRPGNDAFVRADELEAALEALEGSVGAGGRSDDREDEGRRSEGGG